MKNVSVILVGIGGYGGFTGKNILENREKYGITVKAVVEPFPQNSPIIDLLGEIPVYKTVEEFYERDSCDLAIISTPIYLHEAQCIYCMEHGSHVLCEKPAAPTVEQAQNMLEASRRLNKTLNIGFQLSFTPGIIRLKEALPTLGAFMGASALICWQRNKAYFDRPWAAKRTFNGQILLDSVAMNACAHYLHNFLFLLGDKPDEAAFPEKMRAALVRVNDIEMFDTAAMEVIVKGAPVRFSATHACAKNVNPLMYMVFEKATVYILGNDDDNAITVRYNDGKTVSYGSTVREQFNKFPYCFDEVRGLKQPVCTVKTALPHLVCINAADKFCEIKTAEKYITENDARIIPQMDNVLIEAFRDGRMPWEASGTGFKIENPQMLEALGNGSPSGDEALYARELLTPSAWVDLSDLLSLKGK